LVFEYEKARPGLKTGIPAEDHRRALSEGQDVPEQRPSFQIHLSEVGISGKTVWVSLPQGRLPFEAEIYVDLPEDVRGIHMSRMEQAIADLHEINFDDPRQYALALARDVLARQRGERAQVSVSGKIPLVRRTAVTDRLSVEALDLSAEVRVWRRPDGIAFQSLLGLSVRHITACPCTQVYNQSVTQVRETGFPLITHSQRSATRLRIEDADGRVSYEDLLECLESTLHVTQDLLKRPDEAEIVLQAHRYPQFAEDVVREVARETGRRMIDKVPPSAVVIIESHSLESIHIHDVRCALRTTLGEISAALAETD